MQVDNSVMIPPEVEQHLAPEAVKTARCMAVVPWGDAGCQFEIHAGGADVEIYIDNQGNITGVSYERAGQIKRQMAETEASRLSDHLQHDHPAECMTHSWSGWKVIGYTGDWFHPHIVERECKSCGVKQTDEQ